jgi:hypothetical protein
MAEIVQVEDDPTVQLQRGQIFEFHSAPTGEVWEYELETAEPDTGGLAGWARLRNLETGDIARPLCKALRSKDGWPSRSFWKRVES